MAVPPHLVGRSVTEHVAVVAPAAALPRAQSAGAKLSPLLWISLLFCATNIARPQEWLPGLGSLPVAKILGGIGVVVLFSSKDSSDRLKVWKTSQGRAFLFFLAVCILSIPTSLWIGGSVMELKDYAPPTILFLVVVSAASASLAEFTWVIRSLVLGTIALAAAVVLFGGGREGRFSVSDTYDANDLAMIAVVTLPLAGWVLRDKNPVWRIVGGIGGAATLFIIVKTASRGGVLGLGAVLLVAMTVYRKAIPAWGKVVVILGVAALPFVAPSSFIERITTLETVSSDYNVTSETGRVEIWKRGMGYYASRPVTGVGLGAYTVAEGQWAAKNRAGGDLGFKFSVAHNMYVQVAAELGTLGFLAFLWMYIPTFRDAGRADRIAKRLKDPDSQHLAALGHALTLSIVGFAVCGIFLASARGVIASTLLVLGMVFDHLVRQRRQLLAATK